TLQQLRQLKLSGMADALTRQLEQTGTYDNLPFIERVQLLLDEKNLTRTNRKQDRFIRQAYFKLKASVQNIDYLHPRNITQSQFAPLLSITTLPGNPFVSMAWLKNAVATVSSRHSESMELTVSSDLSTARYK
ncbi:hypothetical protein SAMN05216302_10691, partial [Nitrosomonas aestuarii]